MKVFGTDLRVVIASLLVAIAVLMAGRELVIASGVRMPLSKALASMEGVKVHHVEKTNDGILVTLELEEAADLGETYAKTMTLVSRVAKGQPSQVRITDSRNGELSEAYYRSHFIIHEAISTGRFSEMIDKVEQEAYGMGIDTVRLVVDHSNVYVTMQRGDARLLEVVPRGNAPFRAVQGAKAGVPVW